MKVLWLYQYMPQYNFDHALHMDVALNMANDPNFELKAYGLNLEKGYPNLCITPYFRSITLAELHERFPFDVVIVNTKSRCFKNYLPKYAIDNTRGEIREGEWLPPDFTTFKKAKKIVIEEDYHYEDGDSWYKERDISLVLQRHYVNVEFGNSFNSGVKHMFFPFSVDTTIFKDHGKKRIPMITYTGSINTKYYIDRHTVVNKLKPLGLITQTSPAKIQDNNYINDLNTYKCHLSGQSTYYILPAKIFEIASCGSVLWTNCNPKSGIQEVFPSDCYVPYKDNYEDVEQKARWIIAHKMECEEIVRNAKKHIQKHHTHEIRNKQLVELLQKEL